MESLKDILARNRRENNILTPELIATLDYENEYIKDGDIYCKKCNTKRTCFALTQKLRCICKCEAEKMAMQEELEAREMKLRRVSRLKVASLLGERYHNATFENTMATGADYSIVYNRCRKYCDVSKEVLARGIGIYLWGKNGVGKTHLTACMANKLIEKLHTVLFTNFGEISKSIRASFDGNVAETEASLIYNLTEVEFLFIDDFGTEIVTKNDQDMWLQEKIFDIINTRYNKNRPTIFSSNYTMSDLVLKRGLMPKTVERIAEVCESMELKGDSHRKKSANSVEKLF